MRLAGGRRRIARLDMGALCGASADPEGNTHGCVFGLTAMLFPDETIAAYEDLEAQYGRAAPRGPRPPGSWKLDGDTSEALFYGVWHPTAEDAVHRITSAEVAASIDAVLAGTTPEEIWE